MDLRAHFVGLRVVAWEQFNVPIHAGQRLLPFGRRQLGVRRGTVPIAQVVVRVQFNGSSGVLYGLLGLRRRCNRVGVGSIARM